MVIWISNLTCIVILLAAVGNIDTSGISMLEEVNKITERRELQVILSLVWSVANYEPIISYNMFNFSMFDMNFFFPLIFHSYASACFGQSWKWGDEEAEQIKVPKSSGAEMDVSDCWRGRWSMQLHA